MEAHTKPNLGSMENGAGKSRESFPGQETFQLRTEKWVVSNFLSHATKQEQKKNRHSTMLFLSMLVMTGLLRKGSNATTIPGQCIGSYLLADSLVSQLYWWKGAGKTILCFTPWVEIWPPINCGSRAKPRKIRNCCGNQNTNNLLSYMGSFTVDKALASLQFTKGVWWSHFRDEERK